MSANPQDDSPPLDSYTEAANPGIRIAPPPPKPELFIDGAQFVGSIKPPEWLLEGIIQRGYLYGLTAQTNHGKTALAAPLAISLALGIPFAGKHCESGHVLYLCGENPDDFKLRLLGACYAMGLIPDDIEGKITVMPHVGNLTGFFVEIMEFALHTPLSAIIVDTSVAYFGYEDENANVQARMHAQDLRNLISVAGKPAVTALCHPIKGATEENLVPRGGGAFLNELDCNLTLWKDGEIATLSHNKMRGPAFQSIQFQIEPFILPEIVDTNGNPVQTVVMRHMSDHAANEFQREQVADADAVLRQIDLDPDQSLSDIATRCDWHFADGRPDKSKVQRLLNRLIADSLIKKLLGSDVSLTESGRNRIKTKGKR